MLEQDGESGFKTPATIVDGSQSVTFWNGLFVMCLHPMMRKTDLSFYIRLPNSFCYKCYDLFFEKLTFHCLQMAADGEQGQHVHSLSSYNSAKSENNLK